MVLSSHDFEEALLQFYDLAGNSTYFAKRKQALRPTLPLGVQLRMRNNMWVQGYHSQSQRESALTGGTGERLDRLHS